MIALRYEQEETYTLPIDQVIHGDCLHVIRGFADCSVDCCVTDPPYGFGVVKDIACLLSAWLRDEDDSRHLGKSGFMGKEWDAGVPGPRYWQEVYRVMKPGAHLLAFSSTRTYDLLVIALRLSNFEIRDQIMWVHAQGFPKSLDIGKVTGLPEHEGMGTALKPAHEPICLARKPLSEGNIAANVLTYGVGAINIDACRVSYANEKDAEPKDYSSSKGIGTLQEECREQGARPYVDGFSYLKNDFIAQTHPVGRWPANLLLSHTLFCEERGVKRVRGDGHKVTAPIEHHGTGFWGNDTPGATTRRYNDEDGMEEVTDWLCDPSCPVYILDQQSGVRKSGAKLPHHTRTTAKNKNVWGDRQALREDYPASEGGASRFFQQFPAEAPFIYCSKSSRSERNAGCEELPEEYNDFQRATSGLNQDRPNREGRKPMGPQSNHHPTVKPEKLISYLATLVTLPGGIILDPFAGSGTLGVCAVKNGFRYILIEQDASYVAIAKARIRHARGEVGLWADGFDGEEEE